MTRRVKYTIITVPLALLIIIGCLLPSKTPQELTVYNVVIWADEMMKEFDQICAEWGEKNNVKVTVVPVPLEDIAVKISSYIQSKEGADLAVFPAHQIAIYHNALLDVTDLSNEIARPYNGFYEIATQMTSIDGKFYGIPLYAWSHLWVYNKDMLERIGASPAKTFAEARDLAVLIRDATGYADVFPYGIGLGPDDDAAMFLQALLWSYGGSVVASDGKTITINSTETKEAFQYIIDLYIRDKVIPPGAFGWDGSSNNKNFLAERIVFTMNSPTIYTKALEVNPSLARNCLGSA